MECFSYSGTELDGLAEADNYYRWMMRYFAPYLGKRVVEVGAGIGTFSAFLLNDPRVSELVLVEPADNLFPFLQRRYSADPRVRLVKGYLETLDGSPSADSVVLVNVLEHTRNDNATLETIFRILRPGGTAVLFVPALPWLYGSLDETFEHFRRYTKSQLYSQLKGAGFRIDHLRYFNFPGILTWFLAGKILRRRTIRSADVRLYDRWVVPWASRLESFWEPPLGQSVLAIARK